MLKKNSKPKFLAVDFYCGAGGATRGLLDAGGYVIAGVDKDRECRSTYQSNNPNLTLDRATPAFLAKDMFAASARYPHGQQAEIQDHLAELISTYKAQTSDTPMLFTICAPCQAFNKFIQPVMTAKKTVARGQRPEFAFPIGRVRGSIQARYGSLREYIGHRTREIRLRLEEFHLRFAPNGIHGG